MTTAKSKSPLAFLPFTFDLGCYIAMQLQKSDAYWRRSACYLVW
jgi:hypothetical protein